MWTQRLHKEGSISLHSYAGWSKGPDWLFSQFCAQAVLSQSCNLLLLPGRSKLYLVSRTLPLLRTNLYLVGLMFTYKPIKTVILFHRVQPHHRVISCKNLLFLEVADSDWRLTDAVSTTWWRTQVEFDICWKYVICYCFDIFRRGKDMLLTSEL